MFTIDQLFSQIFPWMEGISWDLGTILTALVFLWFLVLAFDWVMMMMGDRVMVSRSRKAADYWEEEARTVAMSRDTLQRGSTDWAVQDALHRKMVRRAADLRMKSWRG